MATIELGPGARLLDGRYEIERLLGTGGMASVWLATDSRLGRSVAVKVIADTLAADPAYRKRFEREARLAAGLSHPGLVRVYDFAAGTDRPLLVMEYVAGGTLADGLALGSRPDGERLAHELLDALAHIHDAGIVHRDIKPANVLIGGDGRVRLTDFGIAHSRDATRLTMTGNVVGTLRYLAPEVVRGEPASPASDLYALGTLLEEVSGDGRSTGLRRLIERLTASDAAQRPASAAQARALLDARPAATIAMPAPTAVTVATHTGPGRRHLALGLLAAAAVLVAVVLGAGDAPAPDRPASAPSVAEQRDTTVDREADRIERLIRQATER